MIGVQLDTRRKTIVPYLNALMDWSRTSPARALRALLWAERFADADVATRLLEESGLSVEACMRVALMPILAVQVDDPMPREILDEVELDARRRFHARSFEEDDDGVSFTLPCWLAWRPSARHRTPPRDLNLNVTVRRGLVYAVMDASTGQPLNGDVLHGVRLRRARPSKRRREAMAARHRSLLTTLAALASRPLRCSNWLTRALADSEAAERRALLVWRSFLEKCAIPHSFRIGARRELSLRDLLLLQAGGWPVLAFAEMYPWVTWSILGTEAVSEEFAFIKENPTRSIGVAARWVCCSYTADTDLEETGCPEAMALAKRLSRFRHEGALDDLLGKGIRVGGPSATGDRQIRSILAKSHSNDAELLSHARHDFARARRNAETALRTLFALYGRRASSFNAAHELAGLALRMGVRERVEPALNPDTVAAGLRAFSADCLAAHFRDETRDGDVADPLDRGMLAFIRFLGNTRRPRMTSRQLARFTDAARHRGVHRVESIKHLDGHSTWPPPLGWTEGEAKLAGIVAKPLLSAEEMLDWGNRVANCLARGWYQDRASTGSQAVFALHDDDGDDGTLSLKAVHERREGKVHVVEWRKDMIAAAYDGEATERHRQAAEELVKRINARCPMEVPAAELARRARVTQAREGLRSFNSDRAVARKRWRTIYRRLLPRGIAKLTLEEIVKPVARVR